MKSVVPLFVMLISFCAYSQESEFMAIVSSVPDGNTIEVPSTDNQSVKIILAGIDSPEPGQTYFEQSKNHLQKLLLHKEVHVKLQGKNRWGDYLGVVTIVKNQIDPRFALLEEGLAWTAEKNPDPELESIRAKAHERRKGLWKENNPTPPWIFRRQQTMMQPKSSE